MQWTKEVELVESVEELRTSSSIRGISMPNLEVLDARIASALNKIIHNASAHTSPHVMSERQTPAQDQRCQSEPSAKKIIHPL